MNPFRYKSKRELQSVNLKKISLGKYMNKDFRSIYDSVDTLQKSSVFSSKMVETPKIRELKKFKVKHRNMKTSTISSKLMQKA